MSHLCCAKGWQWLCHGSCHCVKFSQMLSVTESCVIFCHSLFQVVSDALSKCVKLSQMLSINASSCLRWCQSLTLVSDAVCHCVMLSHSLCDVMSDAVCHWLLCQSLCRVVSFPVSCRVRCCRTRTANTGAAWSRRRARRNTSWRSCRRHTGATWRRRRSS